MTTLLAPGCRAASSRTTPATPASSLEAAFHPEKLAEMDAAIEHAIAKHDCPGAVLWVERDRVAYHKAYGERALVPAEEPMTEDSIVDAAALTKAVETTPAGMRLV